MLLYNYDEYTKGFVNTSEARLDKLQTQHNLSVKLAEIKAAYLVAMPNATEAELNALQLSQQQIDDCQAYLLPANATFDAIPAAEAGKVAVFENGAWSNKADHIGETIYDELTGESQVVDQYGDIPAGWSSVKPDLPLTEAEAASEYIDFLAGLESNDALQNPISDKLKEAVTPVSALALVLAQITKKFQYCVQLCMAGYTQEEIQSWDLQRAAADSWEAYKAANDGLTDGTADYTQSILLMEMAKQKNNVADAGLTIAMMDERQAAIYTKSNFYMKYCGGLNGLKRRLLDEAAAVNLVGLVDQVDIDAAKAALFAIDTDALIALSDSYFAEVAP